MGGTFPKACYSPHHGLTLNGFRFCVPIVNSPGAYTRPYSVPRHRVHPVVGQGASQEGEVASTATLCERNQQNLHRTRAASSHPDRQTLYTDTQTFAQALMSNPASKRPKQPGNGGSPFSSTQGTLQHPPFSPSHSPLRQSPAMAPGQQTPARPRQSPAEQHFLNPTRALSLSLPPSPSGRPSLGPGHSSAPSPGPWERLGKCQPRDETIFPSPSPGRAGLPPNTPSPGARGPTQPATHFMAGNSAQPSPIAHYLARA